MEDREISAGNGNLDLKDLRLAEIPVFVTIYAFLFADIVKILSKHLLGCIVLMLFSPIPDTLYCLELSGLLHDPDT